jgi:hypothetical protein
MIRYQLQCDAAHTFEAWFGNSAAYDKQSKRGLIACPQCGSAKVDKCVMAPNIGTKANKKADTQAIKAANSDAAHESPSYTELRTLMRRLRRDVEKNAEYVGPNFAEEARKIHYEETEARGIYGEATMEEAKSLQEEGVEFLPLPALPEEQN